MDNKNDLKFFRVNEGFFQNNSELLLLISNYEFKYFKHAFDIYNNHSIKYNYSYKMEVEDYKDYFNNEKNLEYIINFDNIVLDNLFLVINTVIEHDNLFILNDLKKVLLKLMEDEIKFVKRCKENSTDYRKVINYIKGDSNEL